MMDLRDTWVCLKYIVPLNPLLSLSHAYITIIFPVKMAIENPHSKLRIVPESSLLSRPFVR